MRLSYTGWLLTLLLGIGMVLPTAVQATHVRAGEITTRRISNTSLTYEITLTAYYDEVKGRDAARDATDVLFCLGDGTQIKVPRVLPIRFLNRGTSINTYRTTYTYAGPGTYSISARIINRNNETRNINGGQSLEISFFVTTTISAIPILGLNSSPILLNPPVDSARIGQKYCHNPAAYDIDGDSIAYRIATPQQSVGNDGDANACQSFPVTRYQLPNLVIPPGKTEGGTGPASFSVNAKTGDVCWDAPVEAGQYNYAFIIEEWRNGVLIGEITRDVQVIVGDSPNRRPLLDPIADICAEAGTQITQAIRATDPDGNRIIVLGYGGPFNLTPDRVAYSPPLLPPAFATLSPDASAGLPTPVSTTFNWLTNCGQLRQEPYLITIKAADIPNTRPPIPLTAYQSFQIQLIGPKPQNLTALATTTPGGRNIQLNWSAYSCLPPAQAGSTDTPKMLVYRKEGCATTELGPCMTGIVPGYALIANLPITATAYTDTSTTLRRGVSYSYRIVAQYPLPTGGQSVASLQACVSLPQTAPVLSQVTVDSTGNATGMNRGVITVRWTRPLGIRAGDGGGPFQYRLLRAPNLSGTAFTQVTAINTTLATNVIDTVFTDRGVATATTDYRYRIDFYTTVNGVLTMLDGAEPASSVKLVATGGLNQITLNWQTNTPWTNDRPTRLFRSRRGNAGPFNAIADVAAGTLNYVDTGADLLAFDGNTGGVLSADSSYCYRVQTVGQYTDLALRARTGTIRNYSPIQCAAPGDTTRPCAPVLTVDLLNCSALSGDAFCNQTTFSNKLTWSYPAAVGGKNCDQRISRYNIYYARYQGDSLKLIATVAAPTTTFLHQSLTSVAGCYYVTAVSLRGIESSPSNQVCKDICPNYALPNAFTPNGDGRNDVFVALACPAFVESVQFTVYNRWGAKVYESSGPVISWDGRSSSGAALPGGVYYYEARVVYAGLVRGGPIQQQKGTIQLIRDATAMR